MTRKLYYNGMVFPKSHLISGMKEYGLKKIHVFEAVRELNTDYFYCRASGEVGTKEETVCGKSCRDYVPRNGKNGCCKHRGFCYVPGNELILNV